MSQAELNSGKVKMGDIREVSRQEFLDLLDQLTGTKVLVWDQALTGPMGLVAEYSILKEHEVVKMFPLAGGPLPPTTADNIVFITRPTLSCMDSIADNIKQEERRGGSGVKTEFHVFFVPRKSLLCEKRLVQAGVFGSLTCFSLPMYFFPLDTDLLSMELPTAYADLVSGDMTSLHYAATAITRLQAVTGVIPRIYGKGAAAAQVFDLVVRMKRETCGQEPQVRTQVDTLVILDRGVDLISTLPTQLTYEGLIDEMYGIDCASVKLPDDKTVPLSSMEELYQELRGLNFNAVGPTLSRKAKNISAQFEERHEARTVREIKQFVDRLPGMQAAKLSLATHTTVAEMVKEKIDSEVFLSMLELEQSILSGGADGGKYLDEVEDLACTKAPLSRLLRLICLQSVVNSGLKPKLYDQYRRLVLQTYGHSWLITLDMLCSAGLLVPNLGTRSTYSMLRKRLGLIIDNVDEQNPSDIAYVHSVYGPLSVKLAMQVDTPGWRNIRDVLDLLPGPSFEDTQQIGGQGGVRERLGEKKVVLVFFVGGVTMAEVAALRFLSQQEDSSVEYLVATTSIITGNTFIESLSTNLEAPAF
jgi:hypothetical protein